MHLCNYMGSLCKLEGIKQLLGQTDLETVNCIRSLEGSMSAVPPAVQKATRTCPQVLMKGVPLDMQPLESNTAER